jgi:hypothetical protein
VPTARVGLVDWEKELGGDASLYRPESYSLLETAAKACPRFSKADLGFQVEVKGIVEYKKGLFTRATEVFPPSFPAEAARKIHYDVELAVLEFVKVSPDCRAD